MAVGFSQTFGLNLQLISAAIRALAVNQSASRAELMRKLGVGDNKAEAMVTWLSYLGLRDNKARVLTPLGDFLSRHDPYLETVASHWVLHYQLASHPEAEVWSAMTNGFLPITTSFTFDEALEYLSMKLQRPKSDRHLASDLSIFIKAFLPNQGLSLTQLLASTPAAGRRLAQGTFHRTPPRSLPPFVLAYVLYDQRDRVSHDLCTTTIQEILTQPGNAGRVFSIGRDSLEGLLKTLSSDAHHRLVQLALTAGLDQVVLTFHGPALGVLTMQFESRKDEG